MSLDTPSLIRALPLCQLIHRSNLNLFRGEPAITVFDELFTPRHNSSQAFAVATGSVLLADFSADQPGHD